MLIYGGEGDDVMTTDRDDSVAADVTLYGSSIYGGAGNDKIRAPTTTFSSFVYGGEGDDKITSAPLGLNETQIFVGGDGNDILYGGDDRAYGFYYGD